jgi:hypothetical protein
MATQKYIDTIIKIIEYGYSPILKNTKESLNRMKLEITNNIEHRFLDIALTISNLQIYNENEIRKIEQNEMCLRVGMIMFLIEYEKCLEQKIYFIKLNKMFL